ncbi:NAD-dependent protein deacylase [Paenibacillus sp. 1011MAR3C5]|uniref:NAD-dependent protein deacylase n=1 Tax=Paenibacillus sp. 1011MAR3C5 TaxID=1675787 RepID=UPI000E6C1712|nr:NAD-dependent protein deacylase [Paenibacillus sp. 1011MAR3C5]RJE85164.1 NAD-dependent protein deacylase [Paenibacillus sp. 1011MAR3C5]
MHSTEQLTEALYQAKSIAVLTGAGISTASGIPDFRSRGGLYDQKLDVETILSETYYHRHPKTFWTYFKTIFHFQAIQQYEPNLGHLFLHELEQAGKEVTIITQNVDGLHSKAGSSRILDVHGSIHTAYCPKCRTAYGLEHLISEDVPRCAKDGFILKPDVVLFEGMVKHLEEAFDAAAKADLFLAIGTSLKVYPVKELPRYSKGRRALLNREATEMDGLFDIVVHGDIVETFRTVQASW